MRRALLLAPALLIVPLAFASPTQAPSASRAVETPVITVQVSDGTNISSIASEPLPAPIERIVVAVPVATVIQTPPPEPAPVLEPAYRQEVIWLNGSGPASDPVYICWSSNGLPVGQQSPTCPAGWTGHP